MNVRQLFRCSLVSLVSLGLVAPRLTFAAAPLARQQASAQASTNAATQASMVIDIALGEGGVFRGQVLDQQGAPLASTPVSLWRQHQQVGASVTDSAGNFAVAGLGGGIYHIVTPHSQTTYRLWAPNTAPAAALGAAMIVAGSDTVRGQFGGVGLTWPRALILAGLVGAAIALPIALSNNNDDDAS